MTQTLTHSILNDLDVPRHKDGNRLGIGSRSKIGTAQRSIKGTPRVYQPLSSFRPNDLGNYRGKRPYTGWRGGRNHRFQNALREVNEKHGPAFQAMADSDPKPDFANMTQPELLAHMLKVDADQ